MIEDHVDPLPPVLEGEPDLVERIGTFGAPVVPHAPAPATADYAES